MLVKIEPSDGMQVSGVGAALQDLDSILSDDKIQMPYETALHLHRLIKGTIMDEEQPEERYQNLYNLFIECRSTNQKILAIKSLRLSLNISLKLAKKIMDLVWAGAPTPEGERHENHTQA